jgi:hypothetical protein
MRYSTFLVVLWYLIFGAVVPTKAQNTEQVVRAQLTWKGYAQVINKAGGLRRVPALTGGIFRSGEQNPNYQIRIQGRVSQGQVRNAVYEAFSPADAKLFDPTALPAAADVSLTTGTERQQPITFALVPAVRRSPQTGLAEKLVSFEYGYSLSSEQNQNRAARIQKRKYASASVLSQGDWFKIGVAASGVYKLDKKALEALGINMQGRDPHRLRIYGNAMGTLPQANSAYRPDDLAENAIYVAGENDNTFDDADYVLFYARGPHTWELDNTSSKPLFRHNLNVYTDTAYYFVTIGNTPGLRVGAPRAITGTPTATVTQFLDRQFHEQELINLAKSGRQWLGEGFTSASTSRDVAFTIPDMVPGAALQLTSQVVAASAFGQRTSFLLSVNGTSVGTQFVDGFSAPPSNHPEVANSDLQTFAYTIPASPASETRVRLAFNTSADPSGQGYLDYLEVNAPRRLRLTGSLLEFNSLPGAPLSEFLLGAASSTSVWEVTNPRRPRAPAIL